MGNLGRFLDARKTLSGKIISIVLSVLLATMTFNWIALSYSDNAFAEQAALVSDETTDTKAKAKGAADADESDSANEKAASAASAKSSDSLSQDESNASATHSEKAAEKSTENKSAVEDNSLEDDQAADLNTAEESSVEENATSDNEKTDVGGGVQFAITAASDEPNEETEDNNQDGNQDSNSEELSATSEDDEQSEENQVNQDTNGDGLIVVWDENAKTLTIIGEGASREVTRNSKIDNSNTAITSVADQAEKLEIIGAVKISPNNWKEGYSDGVFYGGTINSGPGWKLREVSVKGDAEHHAVIGPHAFGGLKQLTSVNLENTIIGSHAFKGCSVLTTVSLTNIEMPNGCEKIFELCPDIENATITNSAFNGYEIFYGCKKLKTLSLKGVFIDGSLEDNHPFKWTEPTNLVILIEDSQIGAYAFFDMRADNLTIEIDRSSIETGAFKYCDRYAKGTGLVSVKIKGASSIAGDAFEKCNNIKDFTIEDPANTKLGYINVPGELGDTCVPGITERMEAILADQFNLDKAPSIQQLTLDPLWTSGKAGSANESWDSYDNATQVIEQARWIDEKKTIAEVEVDTYYTAQKQMDFLFVVDLSRSMAYLGNNNDMNARFYDMQSKVLDVTDKLLSENAAYDCQVGYVTFGGRWFDEDRYRWCDGTTQNLEFTSDKDTAKGFVNGLKPYYQNTDYVMAMTEAEKLVNAHDNSRPLTVVFISDGRPTYQGTTSLNTAELLYKTVDDAKAIAQNIEKQGVKIYGVLQSLPNNELAWGEYAMRTICSENLFFKASDTKSFSDSVNNAIEAAYTDYVMTIPVGDDFATVESITVDTGTATYNAETHEIIWKITGMPFTKHRLTYNLGLKNVDAKGAFDVNRDQTIEAVLPGAILTDVNGNVKNTVYTPVLSRNAVTLFYDANGGSGTMKRDTAIVQNEGEALGFTVKANGFNAPEGKEFVGWNTKADGTGVSYVENQSLNLTGDMVLYAQWKDEGDNSGENPNPPVDPQPVPEPEPNPDPDPQPNPDPDPGNSDDPEPNVPSNPENPNNPNNPTVPEGDSTNTNTPSNPDNTPSNPNEPAAPNTPNEPNVPANTTTTPAPTGPADTTPTATAPDNPPAETPADDGATNEAAAETIADDENPLAAFDSPSCWVHYWIIIGIIVAAIYSVVVLAHRRKDIHDLDDFEDDVLGNTQNAPTTNPVTTGSEVGVF